MSLPITNGGSRPQSPPRLPLQTSALRLCTRRLSTLIILLSTFSIISALLLTHLNPARFRIHPLPYISDAGLFDPERIILSIGLCTSSALFCVLSAAHFLSQHSTLTVAPGKSLLRLPILRPVPAAYIAQAGLFFGLLLACALAAFASVPGWFVPHHVFAALFAVAASAWSISIAAFEVAVAGGRPLHPRTRAVSALGVSQVTVVAIFAILWASVITGTPWKMVPNRDLRFVVLAVLEYFGTAAFLAVVRIVGVQLAEKNVVLMVVDKDAERCARSFASGYGIV